MDFGFSTGAGSEYLFVGAPGRLATTQPGEVYLFLAGDDAWTPGFLALASDNPSSGGRFGQALAMTDDGQGSAFVAVGQKRGGSLFGAIPAAMETLPIADGNLDFQGAWVVHGPGDRSVNFAASVAVSGGGTIPTSVASAPRRPGVTFAFSDGTQQDIDPLEATSTRPYGLAIDGDRAAVGNGGGVAILERAEGINEFSVTMTLDPPEGSEGFGRSLALEGDLLLVGAPSTSTNDQSKAGRAYLFDLAASEDPLFELEAPDPLRNERLGWSVAMEGHSAVVAAPGGDGIFEIGQTDGRVLLFDTTTGNLLSTCEASTPSDEDYFGYSVAIYGDTLLVGAPDRDGWGAAFVFDVPEPSSSLGLFSALAVIGSLRRWIRRRD